MEVSLSIHQGILFDIPHTLYINGLPYIFKNGMGCHFTFTGPPQKSFAFVTFDASNGDHVALPREIVVCGRSFRKRCEDFYTPVDATPVEVEQFFDSIAEIYEDVIDVELNRLVTHRMLEVALKVARASATRAEQREVRVLDFGCGTGLSWSELKKMQMRRRWESKVELFGCDMSQSMVELSKRKGFERVEKNDYADTRFPERWFDVILSSFVVHYFVDARPFVEMRRILRPNGIIIFNLPRRDRSQEEYYKSVLKDEVGVVRVNDWTIRTSQERTLPIIRYNRNVRARVPQTKRTREMATLWEV